ncbi:hypothetical protein [Bifidobacterium sp. ESL0745]|uniref:hypothetical protein n=1 Tax=Bifidobacterium sp. ESL0745 TaxID=2983226 RepID=UPI0023F82DE4|nr:hypothetical protein [Bifidobacterium sp. ESL0745]MDF7665510.1 hypothetical protein [Bifidobacterium sp. ESL0745]
MAAVGLLLVAVCDSNRNIGLWSSDWFRGFELFLGLLIMAHGSWFFLSEKAKSMVRHGILWIAAFHSGRLHGEST